MEPNTREATGESPSGPLFNLTLASGSLWVPCPSPFFSRMMHAPTDCGGMLSRKYGFYHFKCAAPVKPDGAIFKTCVQTQLQTFLSLPLIVVSLEHTPSPPQVFSTVSRSGCLPGGSPWLGEPCLSRRTSEAQQVKGDIVFWTPAKRPWESNMALPLNCGILQKFRSTHFSEKQKTPCEDNLFSMCLINSRHPRSSRPTMLLSARSLFWEQMFEPVQQEQASCPPCVTSHLSYFLGSQSKAPLSFS